MVPFPIHSRLCCSVFGCGLWAALALLGGGGTGREVSSPRSSSLVSWPVRPDAGICGRRCMGGRRRSGCTSRHRRQYQTLKRNGVAARSGNAPPNGGGGSRLRQYRFVPGTEPTLGKESEEEPCGGGKGGGVGTPVTRQARQQFFCPPPPRTQQGR